MYHRVLLIIRTLLASVISSNSSALVQEAGSVEEEAC